MNMLKYAPNIAVVISLALVAYELNQNRQSLVESNNLSRIEASNNAFVGSTSVRESIIANIEVWVKGRNMEVLNELDEEIFFQLCSSYMFNLGNLWEADYYSGNEEKLQARLQIAENTFGPSTCYKKYPYFRQQLLSRGKIWPPLIEALDRGASAAEN